MKFQWDEAKNETNIEKHGIDFEDCREIFAGDFLRFPDERHSDSELRYHVLGTLKGRICLVVVTVRFVDGDLVYRLISARKANRDEQERYIEHKGARL